MVVCVRLLLVPPFDARRVQRRFLRPLRRTDQHHRILPREPFDRGVSQAQQVGVTLNRTPAAVEKALRRYLVYLVLATVLPALLITDPLCSALGIQKAHFAEAVSIPLQQMARVVADDGTISEADTELLNAILPLEQVKECYDETTPNAVKFAPDFNDAYLESHKDEWPWATSTRASR